MGAGPAGIVVALEAARAGIEVLLVESGEQKPDPRIQALGEAAEWDPEVHAPMSLTTRRQVGGASVVWGGRCVPYDPVDFDSRPFIGSATWPVSYAELVPYFQRACDWLVCGRALFDATEIAHLPDSLLPGLANGSVRTSALERWSLPTNFGREYRRQLRDSRSARLVTGLTCTRIVCRPGGEEVDHLECRTLEGREVDARGRVYVLACGGLETTRLMLASEGPNGRAIGDHSDHLGRWYMAHVEGIVANVRLAGPARETVYDYERDVDGVYVRRRFSFAGEFQHEQELPNVVAWLANPDLADPRHRSGALSFAYLALASPVGRYLAPEAQRLSLTGERVPGAPYPGAEKGSLPEHLKNLVRGLPSTVRFATSFGLRRFVARRRRAPGFFVYSPSNVYPLQYHGEHVPNPDSRVTLTRDRDALGVPKLRIDLRFSQRDVDGVVLAHEHWDAYLRRTECGRLEYLHEDVQAAVWQRIGGGFHQAGTTRMAARPEDGVVDRDLAVFGVRNLFVASSSTFVTSSQANSTFMIVAFAVRLADHLRATLRGR